LATGDAAAVEIPIGLITREVPPPPLYDLLAVPEDEAVAGADLAIKDNNTTGTFTGQHFTLDTATLAEGDDPAAAARALAEAGRRLLVVHGDDYDAVTRWHLPMPGAPRRASTSPAGSSASDDPTAPLTQGGMRGFAHRAQYGFGDWLYYRILTGNRLVNRLRRRLGLRYWSLAQYLKRKSTAAERYIARFVQAGLDDVRTRRLDGIVCGHIHRAALIRQDGLVYANDGDWVESLTALCETADGTLQLLAHTGQVLGEVPARLRLVPEPERPLPRAA